MPTVHLRSGATSDFCVKARVGDYFFMKNKNEEKNSTKKHVCDSFEWIEKKEDGADIDI